MHVLIGNYFLFSDTANFNLAYIFRSFHLRTKVKSTPNNKKTYTVTQKTVCRVRELLNTMKQWNDLH